MMDEYCSQPVLWPIFEVPGRAVAYGPEGCARMLMDLGDVHVNTDEGYAHSNYIPNSIKHAVRRELQFLGGDPKKYRCLADGTLRKPTCACPKEWGPTDDGKGWCEECHTKIE